MKCSGQTDIRNKEPKKSNRHKKYNSGFRRFQNVTCKIKEKHNVITNIMLIIS